MKQLKNQVVAKEGILQYGTVRLMKRWSNLKQFIGTNIPVTLFHTPSVNPAEEQIVGSALLSQCPVGANLLCADIQIDDEKFTKQQREDFQTVRGFSIGYRYNAEQPTDEEKAAGADGIQTITQIGHLALTGMPRDYNAIMVMDEKKELFQATDFNPFELEEQKEIDSEMEENKKTDSKVEIKQENQANDSINEINSLKKELNELREFKANILAKEQKMALDSLASTGIDIEPYKGLDATLINQFNADVNSLLTAKAEEKEKKISEEKKVENDSIVETIDGGVDILGLIGGKPLEGGRKSTIPTRKRG